QYQPLIDPDGEIRLAMIHPGSFDDPIRISFVQGDSSSFSDNCWIPNPAYETLSHAWGTDEDPSRVIVDMEGDPFVVTTRNLDIALCHIRYTRDLRLIWIDALCIYQSSSHEKSRQVAAMGRVFSAAREVLIWLGPAQDASDEALDLLNHIGSHINWNKTLPFRNGELAPVIDLFERRYWSRVWIRQEI
ncbi:HET-domain-containing protein, partial [Setomelanomma holmii]